MAISAIGTTQAKVRTATRAIQGTINMLLAIANGLAKVCLTVVGCFAVVCLLVVAVLVVTDTD